MIVKSAADSARTAHRQEIAWNALSGRIAENAAASWHPFRGRAAPGGAIAADRIGGSGVGAVWERAAVVTL